MRKQLLIVLFLAFSALLFADTQYYIRVNGTTDYPAEPFADPDAQGREQYYAGNIKLAAGDVVKMYNSAENVEWVIAQLDPYGEYQKFTQSSAGFTRNVAGCYDFYIKLKWEDDVLYIGPGSACDGSEPGTLTYTVAGQEGIIHGAEWDPNNNDNNMTLVNGVYVLKMTDLKLSAALYEYKVVKNHSWNTCYPAGENATFTVSTDGTYTVEYSYREGDSEPSAKVTNQNTGQVEQPTKKSYSSAVPSQCGDVMLQAFYYDSYDDHNSTFKNTRWATLIPQIPELNAYFDLIWLPPSAKSSGGTGYIPENYSDQNGAWGTRSELNTLIKGLHAGNTKVIADIVINHTGNKSNACDFHTYDFSPYGIYTPDATWLTKNEAGRCAKSSNSSWDDGYGDEADYEAARDWDHNNAKVREMCKAYLKWMYNEVGYDGWRYDYCKGFHNSHIGDYNKASGAYFSVMEWWDGNVDVLRSRLEDAGWNTLTFDFATKYDAIRDGIQYGNYGNLKGRGMLGAGLGKHAVTFVDSHDSFNRDDNEMYGKGNSLKGSATSGNLNGVLQANAYILCMPGVPCVFYPHWQKLKDYIGPIIMARHACGVHSESSVSDEASSGFYKAYITGTKGTIYLALGPNSNWGSAPQGFNKVIAVNNVGVYYKLNNGKTSEPELMVTPGSSTFKDSSKGITVTMKANAINASPAIYYTTDGSTPTSASTKYSSPVTFRQTTTLKVVAIANGVSSAVQTYTYTYKAPQTTPIIVRFQNGAKWEKVYLWAWGTGGNVFQSWPGKELQVDKDGWYTYQFDAKYKEINFLFNCGSNQCQSGNLWTDEDACYTWKGGDAELLDDCPSPSTDGAIITGQTKLNIYPNPADDVLNIEAEQDIKGVDIYTLTGQRVVTATANAAHAQISVADLAKGMYLLRVYLNDGWQNTTNFIKK